MSLRLATFVNGEHSPHCTGCPACREDAARLLRVSAETDQGEIPPAPTIEGQLAKNAERLAMLKTGRAPARLEMPPPPTEASEAELRDAEQDEEIPAPPSLAVALAARARR